MPVILSRQYHGNLKCPSNHKLYVYRHGEDGMIQGTCDICRAELYGSFFGCRSCNVDICDACSESTTQAAINRVHVSQAPVQQYCCHVAIMQIPTEQGRLTAAARGERYNGRRPNYRGRRVSNVDYPDPTRFGWEFTGSCEGGRAEFFEMDFSQHGVVKLDFYYTTGTVKTVLDHPRQGVTQLFARGESLSPGMYRAILQNPRHHTGNRYHHRN